MRNPARTVHEHPEWRAALASVHSALAHARSVEPMLRDLGGCLGESHPRLSQPHANEVSLTRWG